MRNSKVSSIATSRDRESAHCCPRCGSSIPAYPHYSAWCDVCDWNLQPSNSTDSTNVRDRLWHRLSVFADEQHFNHVSNTTYAARSVTISQVISLLLSCAIYIFFGFVFWWVYHMVRSDHVLEMYAGIALALVSAWIVFPRFDSAPSEFVLTGKDEFPTLNAIISRIASALDVPAPKVMLTEQFTATFARVGWRRQAIVGLGHPFLSLLNSEELVSLLAHELSHSKDGAITRSPFVRLAYQISRRSWQLFSPFYWFSWVSPNTKSHHVLIGLTIILLPLTLPGRTLETLLNFCSLQDSQRAEYVADAKSVAVAGNRYTLSLLRKSCYQHLAAVRLGYARASSARKYNTLHEELASVPVREIDRIWRIAQRQPPLFNNTHPSIPKRVAFLQSLAPVNPTVTISAEEFLQLQQELKAWPCYIRRREDDWHNTNRPHGAVVTEGLPALSAAD